VGQDMAGACCPVARGHVTATISRAKELELRSIKFLIVYI